jgi:hypothetical protein
MLPSGIATLLCMYLADHPELAFIRVHVTPPFLDRHVSFLLPPLPVPPISTMLPSGSATLL